MASTPKQKGTIARVKRIDPDATVEEIGDQVFVSYIPAWEKGRHKGGEFVPNPNPQRIVMYVHTDGKLYGWGFGNETKPPVELALPITQKADVAEALKARAEARKPQPTEEPKADEPKAEEPKAETTPKPNATTTKKRTTRKSGVTVSK
jgi:hypothetical protein